MKLLKVTQVDNIVYKTEDLLSSTHNRYKITLEVAHRANRKKYEDLDIVTEAEIKPVIRAILEMADKSTPLEANKY